MSGESFYHVLETVESSLVEPEGESVRKTTDDQGMTDTSSLRDFCLYNVFTWWTDAITTTLSFL